MEALIARILKNLLEEFLQSHGERRKQLALILDDYATLVLEGFEDEISDELSETLAGFLDFHHWGNQVRKPAYGVKDVRRILRELK